MSCCKHSKNAKTCKRNIDKKYLIYHVNLQKNNVLLSKIIQVLRYVLHALLTRDVKEVKNYIIKQYQY